MTTSIDRAFGMVMEKLKEKGLVEDTLVVFTSDHGDLALSHGFTGNKTRPEIESIRVPLVMRYPGVLAPRVSESMAGTLDGSDAHPAESAAAEAAGHLRRKGPEHSDGGAPGQHGGTRMRSTPARGTKPVTGGPFSRGLHPRSGTAFITAIPTPGKTGISFRRG